MAASKRQAYVDNGKLYDEMVKHYEKVVIARESGMKPPRVPVSNFVGECIYKIANNLSLRPNFIGYSFRQEMIGDAVETCLLNAHNFNPHAETKGGAPNPFGYFTKICWQAFVHRINREKKEEYVKMRVTENYVLTGQIVNGGSDGNQFDPQSSVDLNSDYYKKLAEHFEKPEKVKKIGLDKFVDE